MRSISFLQPNRLTFGSGCLEECIAYLEHRGHERIHIVGSPSQRRTASRIGLKLAASTRSVTLNCSIAAEPTVDAFKTALAIAKQADADCIVGIGGGSALDAAKLIAALVRGSQAVEDCFGIGLLAGRACHLVCVPTTSGTGSEVSPNAILLDEAAQLKKGVISPYLVPDATFIDPALTLTMPAAITAATGLDALTHCIEAYTNAFAHPLVDVYALQGIALCARSLVRAVKQPDNLAAREDMSMASMYGGLCLGPVNTAAVHALAYPLGGEFHLAHGLSNALLLPHVFRFNAEASPGRHAEVAAALGVSRSAEAGAEELERLTTECGIALDLAAYGVERSAIPRLARSAMTVTRLLKNNPRPIDEEDCVALYTRSFRSR